MKILDDIEKWQKSFGMLPIKLFHHKDNSFILINSGAGNFCLERFYTR